MSAVFVGGKTLNEVQRSQEWPFGNVGQGSLGFGFIHTSVPATSKSRDNAFLIASTRHIGMDPLATYNCCI